MPRRPPKQWFDKMKRKIKKQYDYGEKRINKIVAGIWHDYKPSTQRRMLKGENMGKKKGKKKGKKWGKIGAPHSAKRKRYLAKIRKKR